MIFVNICAIVSYCRNAGNPYLNEKNKKKVRYFKLVIMIWNFAFIAKFVFSSAGVTLLDIDKQTGASTDFWYSVETFANIMFTEVIPFYFVIDAKLVKILTMKFCEAGATLDGGSPSLLEENNSGVGSSYASVPEGEDNENSERISIAADAKDSQVMSPTIHRSFSKADSNLEQQNTLKLSGAMMEPWLRLTINC